MAWEEYYDYDYDPTDYDTKEFKVKVEKETDKAKLCYICKYDYSAWIPKSLIEMVDFDDNYIIIAIPDWFKFKPINKIKEVELGVLNV